MPMRPGSARCTSAPNPPPNSSPRSLDAREQKAAICARPLSRERAIGRLLFYSRAPRCQRTRWPRPR